MRGSEYADKSNFQIESVNMGIMIQGPKEWIFFTYQEMEDIIKEYKKLKTLMVKR